MTMTPWERLTRRIGTMHRLWSAATSDLTAEHMNYRERAGVLPIAFSLLHYVVGEDRNVSTYLTDSPTLWESGNWEEPIGGNLPNVKRGTPVAIAEKTTIGNAAIWLDYQQQVFELTTTALLERSPGDYDVIVLDSIPESMTGSFVGLTYGARGLVTLGDIIDGLVFQHGIRHLGEIEHARSLLGLQGVS